MRRRRRKPRQIGEDEMSDKQYKIVGEPGDYQIMEQFGAYRLSKKRFKTHEAAIKHIYKLEKAEA